MHETNLFSSSRSTFYSHMATDGLGSTWGYFLLKWWDRIDFTLNCKSTILELISLNDNKAEGSQNEELPFMQTTARGARPWQQLMRPDADYHF